MNTFAKLENEWGVKLPEGGAPGETVTVTTRNGATKSLTLGEMVREDFHGRYFKIAPRAPQTIGDLSGIVAMFEPRQDAPEMSGHRGRRLPAQRRRCRCARACVFRGRGYPKPGYSSACRLAILGAA
jgi:hypothetical protein